MTPAVFDGLRVIEFDDGAAQYCGRLLADLGAQVIKVEPPEGSRPRHVPPFVDDVVGPNRSLYFWHYNANKESVVLNLDEGDDRATALRLIATADIVLDGLGPGRLASYGIDRDGLRAQHPALIWAMITPFGETGPWAGYASSDLVQLALGGMMTMTGYDDLPPSTSIPMAPAGGQAAHVAGVLTAVGIVGALIRRLTSGQGQLVDVAVHDALAHSNEMGIPFWEFRQENVRRHTARHGNPKKVTQRQMFRCRDGKYAMCLTLYMNDRKRFNALVEWLDSHGLAEDLTGPRYQETKYRTQHGEHLIEVIERFCAQTDSSEIFHGAQARKLPWAPVNAAWDLVDDVHLRERGAIVDVEVDGVGPVTTFGSLYRFSETPSRIARWAPDLGSADTGAPAEEGA